jgi:hypothetical protein
MFKNVASQKVALFAFDTTTGAPKTGDGANITPYVSKDYGTVTALGTATATEMDSTNAKGWYSFVLTQGETNADALLFTAKSTTSNVSIVGTLIFTTPNRFSSMVIDAAGLADANAVKIGPSGSGTAQTARDIGASVLLSTGTGTGQLDFTSGVVKANLAQILGTALTETAGQIAGAFKKFFNIATPASTMDALTLVATATNLTNAPTSGDFTATMKTSIGTAVAASAVASVTAGVTVTTNNDKTGYALTTGERTAIANEVEAQIIDDTDSEKVLKAITDKIASVNPDLGGLSVAAIASAAATSVWGAGTRLLTAGTNIALAKGTGITGFNDLDASGIRGAVGLASANLDTQIGTLATSTTAAAIKSKTDNLPSDPADESLIIAATDAIYARIGAPAGASIADDISSISGGGGGGIAAGDVWDVALADHQTSGSVGEALANAGASGSPIDALVEGDKTLKDVSKLTLAYIVGKTSIQKLGGKRVQATMRNYSDTKDAIVAQVNGSSRESVVVDP